MKGVQSAKIEIKLFNCSLNTQAKLTKGFGISSILSKACMWWTHETPEKNHVQYSEEFFLVLHPKPENRWRTKTSAYPEWLPVLDPCDVIVPHHSPLIAHLAG